MHERLIMSRIMNDDFVLVLYKEMGISEIMHIQLYINKIDVLRNTLQSIIDDVNGELDYFDLCNGNNDFLFEHFKKWKYLIRFHFKDNMSDYIYIIKNIKDVILKEIDNRKHWREIKREDKYVINFNK